MIDPGCRRKVLVAGIGNIFFGDDGFGVEVVRELSGRWLPPSAKVMDVGIGGIHLAFELMDGYDAVVLVDAVQRGDEPGTVTVMEAEGLAGGLGMIDAHGMDPETMLSMVSGLGAEVGRILVVGCEAADVDERMGLSETVAAAVPGAASAVAELVVDLAGAAPSVSAAKAKGT